MPQIRIEYSSNVAAAFDPRNLALRIHEQLVPIIDTDLDSCKTRIVELANVVVGDGSPDQAMVHVDLRNLAGRSPEQKRRAAEAALAAVEAALRQPLHERLQLTVEVRDLDPANYRKLVLAPEPVPSVTRG